MNHFKAKIIVALAETELGSGMFATTEQIEAAAEALDPIIREAQAKAVSDVGWQWPTHLNGTGSDTRRRLIDMAPRIQQGSMWLADGAKS